MYRLNKLKYSMLTIKNLVGGKSTVQYLIHDNGGRPYMVEINGNQVNVYGKSNEEFSHDQLLWSFDHMEIFIGTDKYDDHPDAQSDAQSDTQSDTQSDAQSDTQGNTILLYMGKENERYKYIFISGDIFSFTAEHMITKYESPIGNSDVPWPYAIDKNGTYYLLIKDSCVKIDPKFAKEYDDPYDYFYDVQYIMPDGSPQKLYPNFNQIKSFHVDDREYTLMYTDKPAEDYERIVKTIGKNLYVIDVNGKRLDLDKTKYIDLMKKYSELTGLKNLADKHIMTPRGDDNLLGFYKNAIKIVN